VCHGHLDGSRCRHTAAVRTRSDWNLFALCIRLRTLDRTFPVQECGPRTVSIIGTTTILSIAFEDANVPLDSLDEGTGSGIWPEIYGLIRSELASNGGTEHDAQHGSILATFTSPTLCVTAAIGLQHAFAAHEWPPGERRIRMGIHVTEASDSPSLPVGYDAQRATRIGEVAHGGQVLVSAAAADHFGDNLPTGASLRDLGVHRLRDLGRPETLLQLVATGLPDGFPPAMSLDSPELPNNLPSSLSPFVGRVNELAEVVALLPNSRLVTLTGAGGSGKTRLALQVGAQVLDGVRDGVWFVELAPVNDPSKVSQAIAEVLEIRIESGKSVIDALLSALRDQAVLLVLDNCEHLIDSVATIADLISRECPNVTLLATSREPLGADGELVYRVRSLSLPSDDPGHAIEFAGSDAVQLFVARATENDAGFAIDAENAHLAASVVRRLDGIPLAIELAAARQGSMSLDALSRRLDERFRMLTGGSAHALPRQQTLDAMIAWSYEMLSDDERAVFRLLSVFTEAFEIDAVRAVCAARIVSGPGLSEIVSSLVSKSLLGADRASGTTWYSMLEVIRHYSRERFLQEDGADGAAVARRRHAEYYVGLCERAERPLQGGDEQIEWVLRLDREWGNIQTALSHFEWEPDGVPSIVQLAWSLGFYDLTRGYRQLYAALQSVLDRTRDGPKDLRCRALLEFSKYVERMDSDIPVVLEAGVATADEALTLARELGERRYEILALLSMGRALYLLERRADALPLAKECLVLARSYEDPGLLGRAYDLLGSLKENGPAAARLHYLEAIACFRAAGDRIWECTALMLAAITGWETREDVLEGRKGLEESLLLAKQLQSGGHMVYLSGNLAITCGILDEFEEAEEYARFNIRAVRRLGMTPGFYSMDMMIMSHCLVNKGDVAVAAQLFGASDAFWNAVSRPIEFTRTPLEADFIARNQANLVAALGESEFERLFTIGQSLSVEGAVDLALGRVAIAA
jgi:predicted ATPase